MKNCYFCEKLIAEPTIGAYNGIEIKYVDKNGTLRIRSFDDDDKLYSEQIIKTNYCPMCGRKLRDDKQEEKVAEFKQYNSMDFHNYLNSVFSQTKKSR